MAPLSDDKVEMTPVDYVARSIVALAQSQESLGKTFHLVNPQQVPLRDIYQAIRACGYDLREVPLDVLRSRAIEFGARSQDETFAAFAHWLMLMAPAESGGETASESAAAVQEVLQTEARTAPPQATIDCAETVRSLERLGVRCPVVDVEALGKLLAFLNRKRALATPMRGGGEPSRQTAPRPLELQGMRSMASDSPQPSMRRPQSLVLLRHDGSTDPLFLIHGLGGHVAGFLPLAAAWPKSGRFTGCRRRAWTPGSSLTTASKPWPPSYLSEIREVQPRGPYLLAGWSMGGLIALEAAQPTGDGRRRGGPGGHAGHVSFHRRTSRSWIWTTSR